MQSVYFIILANWVSNSDKEFIEISKSEFDFHNDNLPTDYAYAAIHHLYDREKKVDFIQNYFLYDWIIFNYISTCIGLFYTESLRNHIYIFYTVVSLVFFGGVEEIVTSYLIQIMLNGSIYLIHRTLIDGWLVGFMAYQPL